MGDDSYPEAFRRPRYFAGQVLTQADLEAEQDYVTGKRRLLNRCLFGCRIACGLAVGMGRRYVTVAPGLLLDCCGREVYVPRPARGEVPREDGVHLLCLSYEEVETDPVPVLGGGFASEGVAYTRILETYRLGWESPDPLSGHLYREGFWEPCGEPHPVPIARVRIRRGRALLEPYPTGVDGTARPA